jgi:hypothetical protein
MKKAFYIGVIVGGLFGIIIALSMDLVLGETLGGGWRKAVASDLNKLFNSNLSENNLIVLIGAFISIGIIGFFGSLIGGIFSVMIARIFLVLTRSR